MHTTPATKSGALFCAALLSAVVAAGCGSSSRPAATAGPSHDMNAMSTPTTAGHTSAGHTAAAAMPGTDMAGMTPLVAGADGTTASAAGLTLKASTAIIPTGRATDLALNVLDASGMPITSFDRDQTKLMHLIVVRTDFTGYQHIHPKLGARGRFTVPLTLPAAGPYHAIADFTTAGKRYALAVAITAPGTAIPNMLPLPSTLTTVDGYEVRIEHGALSTGSPSQLTFTISRSGKPVTALQPYLGAFGHLVALRKPDLAYSHVHPLTHNTAAATITFNADFPSAATYRLFLQFRAAGRVHTAPFTVSVNK
jgi:hypothetical protein